jgi:putative ABC transport system permease protein
MFVRLIADSFTRRPRRKLLTAAALALGMAVATAALSVSLDAGDRLAREFRSLGANLLVTPEADSLPLEIGGVDYRPVNSGAYLPEADLPKLKTIFWHNNIVGFAPILESRVILNTNSMQMLLRDSLTPDTTLIGTWAKHSVWLPDGSKFETGIEKTDPWWQVSGDWFDDAAKQCVVGRSLAESKNLKIGNEIEVDYPAASIGHVKMDLAPVASALREAGLTGLMTDRVAALNGQATVAESYVGQKLKVTGILSTGGPEDDSIIVPLPIAQQIAAKPGQYRKLYVSALSKPEDDFARRDPKSMSTDEFERWSCSPYVSSIAYSIKQVLPGADVRVIHRVADSESNILTRVRSLLWLVTFVALLAAALAVGASSAASII